MADRIYVSTRKGLFRLERQSAGWIIADAWFLGDPVPMTARDAGDGALYASLNHGHFGQKMHRSTDDGKTWDEIAVPAYPERPADREPDICPVRGIEIPWRLELVWALEADGHSTLWCGTIPGGLFKSTDQGSTWQFNQSLWDRPERKKWAGGGYDYPGIHSICIHPQDRHHLTLGVSCGGAWVSADGGESWACKANGMRAAYTPPDAAYDPDVQDPHRLVQCLSDPAALWVQHHNGIFRSTDAGESWQEISDAFGFAVVVHPRQPDTAWFVPGIKDEKRVPADGKLVVTRTRDGGKTFDTLTDGLPQHHAYDLVYRHAMDVDQAADTLAFGSTTGSLWISEDQGDSWQCVSNHLPPIYAVRFA